EVDFHRVAGRTVELLLVPPVVLGHLCEHVSPARQLAVTENDLRSQLRLYLRQGHDGPDRLEQTDEEQRSEERRVGKECRSGGSLTAWKEEANCRQGGQ